jgi:hypothetical protein
MRTIESQHHMTSGRTTPNLRWHWQWVVAALALVATGPALAWSNHALGTRPALAALPEMAALPPVRVETLDGFLADQALALEAVLEQEEQWARTHVPNYPARPDVLRFRTAGAASPAELRQRFVAAARINPASKLGLFVEVLPGQTTSGRTTLAWQQVTTLEHGGSVKSRTFAPLNEGESVAVLDVVAGASDEPDYGLDIGLWADNGTSQGKVYGFGNQPFGNPTLDFSSQAPFHMGFYHESAIVYAAAGFLKRTYPEYRVHLWRTLAAHALASGHEYWGWRFAGWALHYVQDLTQPYHARVFPGVGVPRLLWINALDKAGWHMPKNDAVTLLSSRHLAVEDIQRRGVIAGTLGQPGGKALLAAFSDTRNDSAHPRMGADDLRQGVSLDAFNQADAVDAALERSLPAHYIADPGFDYGAADNPDDLWAVLGQSTPAAREALLKTLSGLLGQFGSQTRAFVHTLLPAR